MSVLGSILFINSGSVPVPATDGGAIQTVFESLALEMSRREWNVGVLSYSSQRSLAREKELEQFNIDWYHTLRKPQSGGWKGVFFSTKIMEEALETVPVDTYENIVFFDPYLAPLLRKKFMNSRIIWHVHNVQTCRIRVRAIETCLSLVVCVSDYVRDQISKEIKNTPCVTINNPIDDVWIRKNARISIRGTVLFSGRIVKGKGLHILASALQQLPDHVCENIELLIAGSTHFKGSKDTSCYIKSVDKTLRKTNVSYRWLGYVPRNELINLYDTADIVVIPSVSVEAATLVSAESQLRECIVLGASIGGIPEMISPSWRSLLFEAGDATDLSRVLQEALVIPDESRKDRVRDSVQYAVEKFQVEHVVSQWERELRTHG